MPAWGPIAEVGKEARQEMIVRLIGVLLAVALFVAGKAANAQHMNDAGAPCNDKVVTMEAYNCFQLAATSADKRLNQTYNKILAQLSPHEQNALRNAERLWVQFRDTTCAAERSLYDGGTAAGVAFVACIEEETRQREIDLLTMYEWRLEK
jgi:uncharacterized protein YecT (DUF1311 family)